MPRKLRLHQKLFCILAILLCCCITLFFGRTAFSTISEGSGLNGDWYLYYGVSQYQFAFYSFTISIVGIYFVIYLSRCWITADYRKLGRAFWLILIYVSVILCCEVYLYTRFEGKG